MSLPKKIIAAALSVGIVGSIAFGVWFTSQPTPFKAQNVGPSHRTEVLASDIKVEPSDYHFEVSATIATVGEQKKFKASFADTVARVRKEHTDYLEAYPDSSKLRPFEVHTQVKKDPQGFFVVEGDLRSSCVELPYSVHRHYSTVPYYSLVCQGAANVISLIDVYPLAHDGSWDVVSSIRLEPYTGSSALLNFSMFVHPDYLCKPDTWGDHRECRLANNILARYFQKNDGTKIALTEVTRDKLTGALTRIMKMGDIMVMTTENSLFDNVEFPQTVRKTQDETCESSADETPPDAVCFIKFPNSAGVFSRLAEHD